MSINKNRILNKISYTQLVYGRIRKKLDVESSDKQIEKLVLKILNETENKNFKKVGKNYYVSNQNYNIRITINSHTFRVITVDMLSLIK